MKAGQLAPLGPRSAALATILSVVLAATASVLLAAVYAFDLGALGHPRSLVGRGPETATLYRSFALVDMASYLPFAVPVLYLHDRFRRRMGASMTLFTTAGMSYVLIGAIGGAILLAAGPPLIESSASPAETQAAGVTLEAFARAVQVGLWGTLELIALAVWFLGIAWLLRSHWPRFASLAVVSGVGLLVSSTRTALTGLTLAEIQNPVDLVVLAWAGVSFAALLWLAARLWRGAPPIGLSRDGA